MIMHVMILSLSTPVYTHLPVNIFNNSSNHVFAGLEAKCIKGSGGKIFVIDITLDGEARPHTGSHEQGWNVHVALVV